MIIAASLAVLALQANVTQAVLPEGDLVVSAATAIERLDQDGLNALPFRSYNLITEKPIPNSELIEMLSTCEALPRKPFVETPRPANLYYECPDLKGDPEQCESDTLRVAVDRASSLHVSALLLFRRLDTPECSLELAPTPR